MSSRVSTRPLAATASALLLSAGRTVAWTGRRPDAAELRLRTGSEAGPSQAGTSQAESCSQAAACDQPRQAAARRHLRSSGHGRRRREGRAHLRHLPALREDSPVSLGEVRGGKVVPYPDADWNSWRNAKENEITPNDHFVCAQSVVADGNGQLWVLDPAAPALEQIVKGGPKLVQIDPASNKVVRVYPFDERVRAAGHVPQRHPSARAASGATSPNSGRGAILVINLKAGEIRRLLDGVSSTQAEKGVLVHIGGKPLRRPDGKAPSFAADGLTLSPNGSTLFWQAISSYTLQSVPTAALRDPALTAEALEDEVRTADGTVIADGLWTSSKGQIFVTSPEDNSVKLRVSEGKLVDVVKDKRLNWPDSLAEGPDGSIFVTGSAIPTAACSS